MTSIEMITMWQPFGGDGGAINQTHLEICLVCLGFVLPNLIVRYAKEGMKDNTLDVLSDGLPAVYLVF